VVFNQTVDAALSRNHPRRQPETPLTVDRWNLATSMAYYKARFADASNFTFTFVGSFTPETIKPLVETYIASLPATHSRETFRDLGIAPPSGIVEKTVRKGIAPKSEVAVVFTGPFDYDEPHKLALRTMALLLQSRLLDTIRQELGGTYSIGAAPDTDRFPQPQYSVRIEWTCDPARTDTLVQRVFQEVEFVRNTRLQSGQMALIRETLTREFEANSQDNRYYLEQISRAYEDGRSAAAASVLNMPDQIAALTGDMIRQAAQTYLNMSNYVKVVLIPETK
jgi:zinc protease